MQISLLRGCIKTYFGDHGADVTAKSAEGLYKHLAPTWDLVGRHKLGSMTNLQYHARYLALLRKAALYKIPEHIHASIEQRGDQDSLVLLCYCSLDKFCHVDYLIDWLCEQYPQLYTVHDHAISSVFDGLFDFS